MQSPRYSWYGEPVDTSQGVAEKMMKVNSAKLTRMGHIISKATNPCILSLLILILMAVTESTSIHLLANWIIILLTFLFVLPLAYIYLRTYKSEAGARLNSDPTLFLKKHPLDILILGLLFGIPGLVGLVLFEAPIILLNTYAALLVGSLAIASCNIFYHASFHLGAVTTLIIMAQIAWGQSCLALLTIIPLIGWAKYQIDDHTVTQLLSGITIAVFVSSAVLFLY